MAVAPNPLQSFLWGQGGIVKTPEDVARDRQVAEALMAKGADYSPVQSWTQGLARAADGVFGGLESRWADEAQQAGIAGAKSKYIDPIAALLAGTDPSSSATPAPTDIGLGVPTGDASPYQSAIGSIESAGSGGYSAVGPTDPKLGPALGKYQVMAANVGPWSKEALGRAVTPDEFLANPQIQDAVFNHQFGKYVKQFGPDGAAQAWFAGPGGVGQGGRSDSLGTSVSDYTDKFNKVLGPAADATAQLASLDPRAGVVNMMNTPNPGATEDPTLAAAGVTPAPAARAVPLAPQLSVAQALANSGQSDAPAAPQPVAPRQQASDLIPLLLQASGDPWAEKQYGPVLNALLEQQFKQMDPGNQLDMRYKQAQIDALGAKQAPEPFTLSPGQQRFDGSGHPIATAAAEPGFRQLTPAEVQQQGLDKTKAWQVGPDNRVYEIGGGGVNVNVGPDGKMGTVPPGMIAVPDTTNPSGVRLVPIPGGPAAASAETAAGKTAATADQNEISSNTIINAASIARKIAATPGNTGVAGSIWGKISQTDAAELRRQVAVLKATATVENLNPMRQSSPTGGALGSVTEGEEAMLAAKAGAIDPNASGPDFNRQIDDYEKTLLEVTNGKAAGDAIFAKTRPPATAGGNSTGAPQPGQVEDGYRFKGGNPADQSNWERVQ